MSSSKPPQVFISYAQDDLETVSQLYRDLKDRGVNVWFDKISLKPGSLWRTEIEKAIPQSRYFLFCISEAALEKTSDGSGFVDDELQKAYEIAMAQDMRHFTIVPVRLEDVGRGDHRLSTFQQFDLFEDWEPVIDHLASVFLQGSFIETSLSNVQAEPAKLHIDIDPGTAPPEEIADILSDLSILYRLYGGSGITFTLDGVLNITELVPEEG